MILKDIGDTMLHKSRFPLFLRSLYKEVMTFKYILSHTSIVKRIKEFAEDPAPSCDSCPS